MLAALVGVGRHSMTMDNFMANATYSKIYLTDTDSCILYKNLKEELWGPQLLRDSASDIFKFGVNMVRHLWG